MWVGVVMYSLGHQSYAGPRVSACEKVLKHVCRHFKRVSTETSTRGVPLRGKKTHDNYYSNTRFEISISYIAYKYEEKLGS